MSERLRVRKFSRALTGVATLVALAGLTFTAGGSAAPEPGASGFEQIDLGLVETAGFKPASLAADRQATVILKLQGASVGQRAAAARAQGKELSKGERAAIRAQLKGAQDSLRGRIESAGGTVLFSYQDAYNGVAVRTALKDLAALAALPGVEAVHPSRTFERDNTAGAQYVRAHEAWNDTGFTGEGVKIAVLDTGVDYTHGNFGGPGTAEAFAANNGTIIEPGSFPTDKVVAGTDFVGDDYSGPNTPVPDPDPLDCNGHGSHVAGSAAGFGVLSDGTTYGGPYDSTTHDNSFRIGPGTAPEASIIAVRVFGCAGFTTEEILVAALEYALEQGADVVNMSLGSIFGRDEEPSTVASNTLSENGVVVVASAGNSGAGPYITGAPAVASRSISVAAIDASSPTFPGANASLSTGKSLVMQNSNGAAFTDGLTLPIVVLRNADGSVKLGCSQSDYDPAQVTGKLVVTVRGVCARVARAVYGQKAGAAAVAMIDTSSGYPPFEGEITGNPDTGEQFTVTIPFFGVRGVLGPNPQVDGDDLVAADGGTVTLTNATVPNPGYQRLAGFSSGGPANVDSDPKPEVTAPGVSVLSTLVGSGNRGTRVSGTSMAAPHTAGVAALVTDAHPDWPTELIKSAIVHTANASSSKILAYEPRRAGSGVVDARKAVDTAGVATTGGGAATLSFGYEPLSAAYSETLPLTLHNTGSTDVTYNLSSALVGSSLGTAITFSSNPVTVPADDSVSVDVTMSLDAAGVAALPAATASNFGALANVRGAVVATPTTSGEGIYQLRVPFALVPRGLSNISAGPKSPYTRAGNTFTASVPLSNAGIHSGSASVYAWGIDDPNEAGLFSDDPMDIRAAGVQVLPGAVLGGADSDRTLLFAINTWGRHSNPSVSEYDILIDLQNDGRPDFFVVGVDLGAVLAGSFNGQFASFIFDAAGNLVNAWVATAPMNGSTIVLPTLASDIGLDPAVNSTRFRYSVNGFSLIPGGIVDTTGIGQFRSHEPPVSTGQSFTLAPGGTANATVSVDRGKFAAAPQLGWMFVSHDDANGAAQADLIPVGTLR
ncbi:MAG: S8 family serine peptidase [Gaiellaceae bacterium]